jgi:hypothetical protein
VTLAYRLTSLGLQAGIAAMAALGAVSAHAGCADPRIDASGRPSIALPARAPDSSIMLSAREPDQAASPYAARNIVGTWLVTYSRQGVPGPQAYIQWHADGTEWENANLPLSGGNICLGSWKVIDMKHVSRNHFGWLYTDGILTGHFNETEMTTVGLKGTYTGVTDTKVYDLSGTLLAEVAGTSSAVRVSP